MQRDIEISNSSKDMRVTRELLSPVEFDNMMFFALTNQLRNQMQSLAEEIKYSECLSSERLRVITMYPKLEDLLARLVAANLATPEMKRIMLSSLIRPLSPSRYTIDTFFSIVDGCSETLPRDDLDCAEIARFS